jgi:hypothetical protein
VGHRQELKFVWGRADPPSAASVSVADRVRKVSRVRTIFRTCFFMVDSPGSRAGLAAPCRERRLSKEKVPVRR